MSYQFDNEIASQGNMSEMESDEDYRNRLIQCSGVGVCWAEDIGDSSGKDLDLIGERFNCPRQPLS